MGLEYTCMHRLVTILETEAEATFISKIDLPAGQETQLFSKSVLNICNTNKNPWRIFDIIKLQDHPGDTRVTLKFLVCETMVASTIDSADFCDQHDKTMPPKIRLVELNGGNYSFVILKPGNGMKLQILLSDDLIHIKYNPQPSQVAQLAGKLILLVHSRTSVLGPSPWACTAVLQPYTSFYEKA